LYAAGIIFSATKISLMKFLANENFPMPSTRLLRESGVAVKSILEECPGISDKQVIEMAQKDNLIILTFDKDYGELIFRYGYQKPPAVVFFRFKGNAPDYAGNLLKALLKEKVIKLANTFTVIEENNIRQRQY
jgi:predicted nuclease of predicted toxin-antitoxin system